MEVFKRISLAAAFLAAHIFNTFGQGTVVYTSGTFLPAGIGGHHIDEFSVGSSVGIRTLQAYVLISPMNQIQVGGEQTVFPTLLAPADWNKDSHFVFDISTATILSQFEDSTQIRTSVEFNSNFPTSFTLARVVGAQGHSFYEAGISGTLVTGEGFQSTVVFVPEPTASLLLAAAAGVYYIAGKCRRDRSTRML